MFSVGQRTSLLRVAIQLTETALLSDCAKLRFASAVVELDDLRTAQFDGNTRVKVWGWGINSRCEALSDLCLGSCIRERLPSRSRPYVGSCLHSEENAIWNTVHGARTSPALPEHNGWVAVVGLANDEIPSLLILPDEWTCIRCATTVLLSGLEGFIRIQQDSRMNWTFLPISAAMAARQAMELNFRLEGDPRL